MRWEMEMEEIEAVLERIWDLHDKVSDAIHAISRAHFLRSIKPLAKSSREAAAPPAEAMVEGRSDGKGRPGGRDGGEFVFVKGFKAEEDDIDAAGAVAEARSLNAIRTALENLEDQLEFFHTVQSQQQAERDAAIARLEQSRIILAMRLADHQGKRYKVIEEALNFVGNVQDKRHFITPESLCEIARNRSGENLEDHMGKSSNIFLQMLISSFSLAKSSFKFESVGGVLGNAAIFAVSMLAILQIHHAALKDGIKQIQGQTFDEKRNENNISRADRTLQNSQKKHLDVLSARG